MIASMGVCARPEKTHHRGRKHHCSAGLKSSLTRLDSVGLLPRNKNRFSCLTEAIQSSWMPTVE